MPSRYLIYALTLTIILWGVVAIARHFNSDNSIHSRLARVIENTMADDPMFADNLVDFSLVEPGSYRVDTTAISSAEDAGRYGFNTMTLLVMSNWNLQTGYAVFTLYGYQDDVLIFEVSNDQWGKAQVTLKGPYENYEYIPNFGSAVPDIDVDGELSRAYSRVTTG